ncbi:MAG: amidohydrolase family protein [Acidimicrobiia bacterium]|nr:amidohydrolase family protein [Acidimicrobiia bacterium]
MGHDLVIRNGLIIDGTGAEAYEGDLAVDGDTISAVGDVAGAGTSEIDADGHAVTPGFVDLHTHFDAQAGWDPLLTPVSWHGVTTALFGNCGVTFAPCKPEDRDFLANMMETVEDIPREAILGGLPWDWESYGEYLDSVEKLEPAINVAGLVGHCASRFYVMGERSIDDDPTPAEIEQIAALIGRSVAEGAVGFSTNRLPGHVLPDGRSIPGTFAKPEELLAISKAVGENGGFLQSVLDYRNLEPEMDLLGRQVRAAGTRLLFSAPYMPAADPTDAGDHGYRQAMADIRAEGLDVSGITLPRSGGFLSGLRTGILFRVAAFDELAAMDIDARLAAIRDPAFRSALVAAAKADPTIEAISRSYFWLGDGDRPHYTRADDESLFDLASAAGEHPVETWLRFMDASDGYAMFHARFFNQDLDILEQFLAEDWVMPGIGDAGAHVSQIMDSGWATFHLAHWYRDKGVFTLPAAVAGLTSRPARVLGFDDRGTLAVGNRADINVIDVDRVAERQPELVNDFPGGAPRLIQRAVGYLATICNGRIILRDDELTGARAGRVLRNPTPKTR